MDQLIPRLRAALLNSTGGTGKASNVNFARLQAELDDISRENVLRFSTPPFFTVILRSLTILEGVALSVDPNFRLVRGAYPYVLRQLLSPDSNEGTPEALTKLLIRLLTVNGEGKCIPLLGYDILKRFLLIERFSLMFNVQQREKLNGKGYEASWSLRKRLPKLITPAKTKEMVTVLNSPGTRLRCSLTS